MLSIVEKLVVHYHRLIHLSLALPHGTGLVVWGGEFQCLMLKARRSSTTTTKTFVVLLAVLSLCLSVMCF